MSATGLVDVVVQGRGQLNAEGLCHHLRPATGPEVTIDLRRLTFAEPAGLVSLAVVSDLASSAGLPVRFRSPLSADTANYLARMRLDEHLDRLDITHDLASVTERELGPRLVELHRFQGSTGLDSVLEALVQTYVDRQPEAVQPLYTALHEMASNVLQHSGRTYGYAAMQRYEGRRDVVFAIADGGIGLRERLSEAFEVPDDRTAVARAAQPLVSTRSDPGRGRGIARVITLTGQHGGQLSLLSGAARGVFARGDPRPQLMDCLTPHPGTVVSARLSL